MLNIVFILNIEVKHIICEKSVAKLCFLNSFVLNNVVLLDSNDDCNSNDDC